MRKLLLLGGNIKAGKDYSADRLVNHGGWLKLTFAEYLKNITSQYYNIPLEEFHTQEGKSKINEFNKTNRQLLIDMAITLKRTNKYYFADILVDTIIQDTTSKNIVISDFRYPYEYERIFEKLSNQFSIKTVKIVRECSETLNDQSETSLNDFKFDYTFYNENQSNFDSEKCYSK